MSLFPRTIDSSMESWYQTQDLPGKIILYVEGARQVGKTTAIRAFLEKKMSPDRIVHIDFFKNPHFIKAFENSQSDDELLSYISTAFSIEKKHQISFDPRYHFFFLDELQECEKALSSLSLILEKGYSVIATGSSIGIKIKYPFPTGRAREIHMYPVSFWEFRRAMDEEDEKNQKAHQDFWNRKPISDIAHSNHMHYFKHYLLIGGMPKAIQVFRNDRTYSLASSFEACSDILDGYHVDIMKYADKEKEKASIAYDSIASFLETKTKKIQYDVLHQNEKNERKRKGYFREYEKAFDWLCHYKVAYKVKNLDEIGTNLKSFAKKSDFKLYMNDGGLLLREFFLMYKDTYVRVLNNDELDAYGNALLENFVVCELARKGYDLYFYAPPQSAGADFVFIDGQGKLTVVAIEPKINTKEKRLKALKARFPEIQRMVKLTLQNIQSDDEIEIVPFYFVDTL